MLVFSNIILPLLDHNFQEMFKKYKRLWIYRYFLTFCGGFWLLRHVSSTSSNTPSLVRAQEIGT